MKKQKVESMKKIGTLYPSLKEVKKGESVAMFMRMEGATAKNKKGKVLYQLDANVGGLNPIVTSSKTGRKFTLSWDEIIELAVAAGIDSKIPIENPTK